MGAGTRGPLALQGGGCISLARLPHTALSDFWQKEKGHRNPQLPLQKAVRGGRASEPSWATHPLCGLCAWLASPTSTPCPVKCL